MSVKPPNSFINSRKFIFALIATAFIFMFPDNILASAASSVSNAPTINNCPNDIVTNLTNSCTTTVSWDVPTATDPNGIKSQVSTHNPGDFFPVGVTTVTYTFTNDLDLVSTCSFNVTVKYKFFDLPSDITLTMGANCNRAVPWAVPTDCGGAVFLASDMANANGQEFPIGITTITYVALRGVIVDDIASFTVTVIDNIKPVFTTCPPNAAVIANENCEAIVNWTEPIITDNCTSGIVPVSNFASGSVFPLGTTTVNYTATDEGGNQATCSFQVIVQDVSRPVFANLPDDLVVNADEFTCEATATWPPITATDNCSDNPDIVPSQSSGSTFSLGQHTINVTAIDDAGNEQSASFSVTVVDVTAPTLSSCPSDVVLAITEGCSIAATWSDPVFDDSCDPELSVNSSHNSGELFTVGTTLVIYTAIDEAGNETTCSFNVVVADKTLPIFENCPSDRLLTTNENCEAAATWVVPTVTDNCTDELIPKANFEPGDFFPVGITEVIYTATDANGNSSECSFTVQVTDNTAPELVSCVTDFTIAANNNCEAIADWDEPVFEDCTSLSLSSDVPLGSLLPIGETTVTYTAIDSLGLSTSCSFIVTVKDELAPELSMCPSDINLLVENGCEMVATWEPPNASDNCSEVMVTSNFEPGDSFPIGTTEVVYSFTDVAENTSSCFFNITITHEQQPDIVGCPENIFIETDDSGLVVVQWEEPYIESICTAFTTTTSHQPGDTFKEGITTVIYNFTDSSGTMLNCTFEVEVRIRSIEFETTQLVTPNNDGNNDNWVIKGIENFPDNEVVVVDRWGNEVFKINGYNNSNLVWDGINKSGDLVPTGTYFYYISVRTKTESRNAKGFLEIIR